MTDISIRPKWKHLTKEQMMFVYDYWLSKDETQERVIKQLTDLHLSQDIMSRCIEYCNTEIKFWQKTLRDQRQIINPIEVLVITDNWKD